MIVLETDRLVLRRLTLNDAPFIVELLTDPAFLRYIGDRGVRDQQSARQYLLKGPIASYEKFGFGLYFVFLKESGDPVGICGLLKRDTLSDVDVGFAFLPAHRRKGYATESAAAVLAHGRSTLGLKRVVAITSPDNEGSIAVLEKIGLRFEGMTRLGDDPREVRLFGIDL
ncbi:MAG: GNAT family N-acetyltransferase [Vicinamibacteria bacterium]|nr:GNAT family N-acetyltransferase [Vicinamibacteria bacterium]